MPKTARFLRKVALLHGYSNDFSGLVALADHQISRFSLENQRLAVGVSGGADSIGLFHVFCELLKQKKISELVVFHINFGLRGQESDGDELFVADLCECLGVRFSPLRACENSNHAPKSGIQEWAREIRLKVQQKFLDQKYIIALGHNCDDVAENVLMRIARGSSLNHAAGMSVFERDVFRPFLPVSRAHIRECLRTSGRAWRDDSSNNVDDYTRNQIRHQVLNQLELLFPGASQRICGSFTSIYEPPAEGGGFGPEMRLDALKSLCLTRIQEAIHAFIATHYGGKCPVGRQTIEQIASASLKALSGASGETRTFHLPERISLIVTPADISMIPRD